MNTPTPETDKAERITKYTGEYMVPTEVARKLERERDEARQALADSLYQAERELASALSDVNLYKTYIAELQNTKKILELQ